MILTSDLYKKETECCGCEACAVICPKNIIEMRPSGDGFIYPVAIDPDKCINCHLCLKVCPLKNEFTVVKAEKHYGGHSSSDEDIRKSASGALATDIAAQFVKKGGIVYGVRYSDDFSNAIFTRCTTIQGIETLRGSKYSQARKHDIFNQIKTDLKADENRVLFMGLPCETYSLKLFLKRDYPNLYTVSLICHGPTSPAVQMKYVSEILEPKSNGKILQFTLRDKPNGWKPYFIKAVFDDGTVFTEEFHPSAYGIAFKELKRPSCAACKFKLSFKESHIDSDLIIGDYHGITPSEPQYNKWGVSQASVLTDKGYELINSLSSDFVISEISPYKAIHYNRALGRTIKPRLNRNQYAKCFERNGIVAASQLKSIRYIDNWESTVHSIKFFLSRIKKLLMKL